jgi:hypothetical protein
MDNPYYIKRIPSAVYSRGRDALRYSWLSPEWTLRGVLIHRGLDGRLYWFSDGAGGVCDDLALLIYCVLA